MPIEAPVERPEVDFEVVEVWPPEDGAVEGGGGGELVDGEDEEGEAPAVEVVDREEDEEDGELELEASTSNRDTGKDSVWPCVALGLLPQAALIISRTVFALYQNTPRILRGCSCTHSYRARQSQVCPASMKRMYLRLPGRIRCLCRSSYTVWPLVL